MCVRRQRVNGMNRPGLVVLAGRCVSARLHGGIGYCWIGFDSIRLLRSLTAVRGSLCVVPSPLSPLLLCRLVRLTD